MLTLPGKPASLWVETGPGPDYPRLDHDVEVDVAVIGGGITGMAAALLLKEAGPRRPLAPKSR